MNWLKRKLIKKKLQKKLSSNMIKLVDKIVLGLKTYGFLFEEYRHNRYKKILGDINYNISKLNIGRETILLMLGYYTDFGGWIRDNEYLYKSHSSLYENYIQLKEKCELDKPLKTSYDKVVSIEFTKINGEVFTLNGTLDENGYIETGTTFVFNDGTKELFQKIKINRKTYEKTIVYSNDLDDYLKRITNIWKKVEKF